MNCDPIKAIRQKHLREDLFYRLSSNMIRLTPLRERKEDILLYANYFLKGFNNEYDKSVEGLSKSLMDIFMQYHWKGNVRELKHIIENMVSISEEKLLTVNSLPIYMKDSIELETREHKGKDKDKDKPFIQFQSLQNTIEDD